MAGDLVGSYAFKYIFKASLPLAIGLVFAVVIAAIHLVAVTAGTLCVWARWARRVTSSLKAAQDYTVTTVVLVLSISYVHLHR